MAVTADANGIYVDNVTTTTLFDDIYGTAGIGGVDFLRVDSGTGFRSFRSLKSIFIGQTSAAAGNPTAGTTNATSVADTNCCVTFDAGKKFVTRTQTLSTVSITLGTKVGTGAVASGKASVIMSFSSAAGTITNPLRGTVKLYGTTLKARITGGTFALQFPNQNSGASEFMNCLFDGFTSYVIGSSGAPIESIYNVDISGDSATNNVTAFFVNSAERLTLSGSPGFNFIASGTAGVSFKDLAFFGTPGLGCISATGANWAVVKPSFPSGVQKFKDAVSTDPEVGVHEYWLYDVKCVDGAGAGVSGIPVRLTDTLGNVQVDTTTDSAGEITFGSGLTTKAVIVADHYNPGTVSIRSRSPFLAEINMSYQTGYNRNYQSHRHYFNWPGSETVTTTSGTFEDVNEIIQMAAPASGGSTWTEVIVP